jgi:hypothetical protein
MDRVSGTLGRRKAWRHHPGRMTREPPPRRPAPFLRTYVADLHGHGWCGRLPGPEGRYPSGANQQAELLDRSLVSGSIARVAATLDGPRGDHVAVGRHRSQGWPRHHGTILTSDDRHLRPRRWGWLGRGPEGAGSLRYSTTWTSAKQGLNRAVEAVRDGAELRRATPTSGVTVKVETTMTLARPALFCWPSSFRDGRLKKVVADMRSALDSAGGDRSLRPCRPLVREALRASGCSEAAAQTGGRSAD